MAHATSLILDVILVVVALAVYFARPRIGGELAKGLRILLAGILVLGFAHLIETLMFVLFGLSPEVNEILHRVLIAAAFVFFIIGFITIRRAFES